MNDILSLVENLFYRQDNGRFSKHFVDMKNPCAPRKNMDFGCILRLSPCSVLVIFVVLTIGFPKPSFGATGDAGLRAQGYMYVITACGIMLIKKEKSSLKAHNL